MSNLIYKLKGGVAISINPEGLITKTATWIVTHQEDNAYTNWKSMIDDVGVWAGKVGDKWKEPVQDSNGRECSGYSDASLFTVTSIEIDSSNRVFCEVTFTAESNLSEMTLIRNANVSIDNLNQKTVSLEYQIDLSTGVFSELEAIFHVPGSNLVMFDEDAYLIDAIDYNPTSKTRYQINIVLRDMSVMRLGNPSISIDAYGTKTASISWRYDAGSYSADVLPKEGTDASDWLGMESDSGYIVSEVAVEPDGLLGYIINIDSKHVSSRLVKTDRSFNLNADYSTDSDPAINESVTITRQAKKDDLVDYEELVGQEASDYGYANHTISGISIEEVGRDDFEVTIEITDDEFRSSSGGSLNNSQNYLRNQVDLSVHYSHLVLEASHLGYVRGVSDMEWIAVNDPPRTTFLYDLDIMGIKTMNPSHWTDAAILAALKTGKIGFSGVYSVTDVDGDPIRRSDIYNLSNLSRVDTIRLWDFVYAQPTQQAKNGESLRNIYFIPWKAEESAIIFDKASYIKNYPKGDNGFDKPMKRSMIGKKIPIIECTVGKYYQGRISKVIKKWEHKFFTDAIKEIKLKGITSYKRTNLSAEEITDNTGRFWTKVTQSFSGLRGQHWNPNYEDGSL